MRETRSTNSRNITTTYLLEALFQLIDLEWARRTDCKLLICVDVLRVEGLHGRNTDLGRELGQLRILLVASFNQALLLVTQSAL